MLEKLFKLKENDTSMRRELVAGLTNFMTISYIVFVQPSLLSAAGMNPGAVMVATCISSAAATFAMGFLTNYPVVLAPGMGLNAYFAFEVCLGKNLPWQEALGIVFIAGALFFILSFVGVREAIMNALPTSLQNAIAIGIGLFIAFIGLRMSGIVTKDPATFITPRRARLQTGSTLYLWYPRNTGTHCTQGARRDSDRYPYRSRCESYLRYHQLQRSSRTTAIH